MTMPALPRRLLVGALVCATLPLVAHATPPRDPAASRQVYNTIHEHLDPGGDLIVIANVDGLLAKAMNALQDIAASAPAMPDGANESAEAFARTATFLKQNGFYAVKGVGVSIVPRGDGLNTIKTFVAREAEAARLPLWLGLIGRAPSHLQCHAYLPKDTVLVRSCTADIRALWQLVRSAVTDIGGSEAATGFNMALDMFTAQVGVAPDTLIQSIAPESALSIQLSSTATATIPMDGPDGARLTIPAPSLLLIMAVNDSLIIDTVKQVLAQNLQMPLPETRLGDATIYKIPVPVPAPFPVALTLATHDKYLLIGSTADVVTDALRAATNGAGLQADPEFAAAFPATTPNNGILFVSSRLGQTLQTIQDQASRQMMADSEELAAFNQIHNMMNQNLDTRVAFSFHNLRPGVLVSGTSASSGQQFVGSMFVAPAGLMAAIAIPSFVKARSTSQKNACINNLRMIDSAKEQWAMAQNKRDGEPADSDGIAQYLRSGIPACPQGGTYTINPIGVGPTCSIPDHRLR